jgi:hypothetical protein
MYGTGRIGESDRRFCYTIKLGGVGQRAWGKPSQATDSRRKDRKSLPSSYLPSFTISPSMIFAGLNEQSEWARYICSYRFTISRFTILVTCTLLPCGLFKVQGSGFKVKNNYAITSFRFPAFHLPSPLFHLFPVHLPCALRLATCD